MHPSDPFNCPISNTSYINILTPISIYFLHTDIYIPFPCTETVDLSCAVLKYSPTNTSYMRDFFHYKHSLISTIIHATTAPILITYIDLCDFFNIVSI